MLQMHRHNVCSADRTLTRVIINQFRSL